MSLRFNIFISLMYLTASCSPKAAPESQSSSAITQHLGQAETVACQPGRSVIEPSSLQSQCQSVDPLKCGPAVAAYLAALSVFPKVVLDNTGLLSARVTVKEMSDSQDANDTTAADEITIPSDLDLIERDTGRLVGERLYALLTASERRGILEGYFADSKSERSAFEDLDQFAATFFTYSVDSFFCNDATRQQLSSDFPQVVKVLEPLLLRDVQSTAVAELGLTGIKATNLGKRGTYYRPVNDGTEVPSALSPGQAARKLMKKDPIFKRIRAFLRRTLFAAGLATTWTQHQIPLERKLWNATQSGNGGTVDQEATDNLIDSANDRLRRHGIPASFSKKRKASSIDDSQCTAITLDVAKALLNGRPIPRPLAAGSFREKQAVLNTIDVREAAADLEADLPAIKMAALGATSGLVLKPTTAGQLSTKTKPAELNAILDNLKDGFYVVRTIGHKPAPGSTDDIDPDYPFKFENNGHTTLLVKARGRWQYFDPNAGMVEVRGDIGKYVSGKLGASEQWGHSEARIFQASNANN